MNLDGVPRHMSSDIIYILGLPCRINIEGVILIIHLHKKKCETC